MSDALEAAKQKAEATYNAASDNFDAEPLAFWDRYGRRTVERLHLGQGARVLDVCCGTGASALHAARAVGPQGSLIGVDLAERLLELARTKAKASGLAWADFRRADMTALGFPDGHFDAIVCVFGIFFVPDMESEVAELWRMVRPRGKLAITTWGPRWLGPAYETFRSAVRRVRPDLHAAFNPWDRITTPDALRKLFADAGIPRVDVVPESGHQILRRAEDFWTIALGSGLRWTIDRMGPEAAADVEREMLEFLRARAIERVETNVIYAVAEKTAGRA
jgi:ubiquinone/menaquinone biosynthesis C-methylase UbiE